MLESEEEEGGGGGCKLIGQREREERERALALSPEVLALGGEWENG